MKARVLIMAIVVAFVSFVNVQAQKPMKSKRGNKVEFRVKRMAGKLQLDESQKEKFTALYQEYLEAKAACSPKLVCGKELTEKQIEANIEEMMSVRKKLLKIDKKYYRKLSKVLDAKQLDMIFGFDAQEGKRPMMHGKDMKAMLSRHFGKPGASKGKLRFSKDFKKGAGCKKAHDCKRNDDCRKHVDCKKMDAACKNGRECNMKADCRKECKK